MLSVLFYYQVIDAYMAPVYLDSLTTEPKE
jgi:hypothetical protein